MKKVLACLLAIVMTATLTVGGTLAYLTNTDEDVNVMTVGKVKIDQLEYERIDPETNGDKAVVQEFHNNKPLYPAVTDKEFDWDTTNGTVDWGQIGKDGYTSGIWNPDDINNELDKMVFVKNKGDFDAYVRTVFAFEAGNYETLEDYLADVHLNLNDTDWTWEWSEPPVEIGGGKYFIATATYNKVLEPGKLTEISLSQIALDPSVTNEDVAGFGDTFQVLVQSQAVQADGFENADSALTEAFGELITDKAGDKQPPFEVIPDDVPFEGDSPVSGTDLRTALHNLNGNTANPITTKVTNVIYALNEEYPEIIDTYEPTLVDVEQDVKVNAYYVPNGSNYDVYFLANGNIYSPANSSKLYAGMSALQTVDTHNYDVSRVTNAYQMFMRCSVLKEMDVSEWDTSNITDMTGIFYQCRALPSLEGINNWDVSSCTTLFAAFYDCDSLTELDMSGWDVSNVVSLDRAICTCDKLQTVNLTDWNVTSACNASSMLGYNGSLQTVIGTGMDVSGITNGNSMFAQNTKLTSVVGSGNWTFSNLTTATWMFDNCNSLPELDVTSWSLGALQDATGMFSGCSSITKMTGSGNWVMDDLINASYMFQVCSSLPYIDVTNWDLGNCTTMDRTFMNCESLVTVEGSENWDVSNVEVMFCTFYNNPKLSDLDVSTWDTGSVTTMDSMFRGALSLKHLAAENWDVSNVVTFRSMFSSFKGNAGDIALESFDMSKWYAPNVEDISYMFYGCAQLKELDFSSWQATKIKYMGHTFSDCYALESFNFSGWKTTNLITMDACFNNCESVKVLDLSMFDMSSIVELTQTFELCYNLEKIIGIETWVTPNLRGCEEMFSNCHSLKELDLSGFDTRNVGYNVTMVNGSTMSGFKLMFNEMYSLEKLVLGENFSFVGDGTVPESLYCALPRPAAINGTTAKWYNAANDTYYAADEIPDKTAATYVAAVEPTSSEG